MRGESDMAKQSISLSNMNDSNSEIFISDDVMEQAKKVRDTLDNIIQIYNRAEGEYKKLWNDSKTKGKFKTMADRMATVCNKRASYAKNQQVTLYKRLEGSAINNKEISEELFKDIIGSAEAMENTISNNMM